MPSPFTKTTLGWWWWWW